MKFSTMCCLWCWSHFFYHVKSQNERYPLANVIFFDIWSGKLFAIWGRKFNWNWPDRSISYKSVKQFQLNLPFPKGKKISRSNVKKISHLQMDIFCHFNFWHDRRNGFCTLGPACQTAMLFSFTSVAGAFTRCMYYALQIFFNVKNTVFGCVSRGLSVLNWS